MVVAQASGGASSMVRTLRGGEEIPEMFCLVASSLGRPPSRCLMVCDSSFKRGHSGSMEGFEEIVLRFQSWYATALRVHKEDHVRRIAVCFAIF